MSEQPNDPLDALRAPIIPRVPDPVFAAQLRNRLERIVSAAAATPAPRRAPRAKEPPMGIDMAARARNGHRHGDVSYITLEVPDLARAESFYGAVLGWRFSPGNADDGAQVDDVVPMVGLWAGAGTPANSQPRAVLGFRVEDIAGAVAAVRTHGGTMADPHPEPYGLAAEGHDNQGSALYLHQLAPVPEQSAARTGRSLNGQIEGDVSYLTMVVPDLEAARAFYGGVFGWSFNIGRAGGAQIGGVAPQMGMTTEPEAGPPTPGVILCYRVDDLVSALDRVRSAGGRAGPPAERPYGLESLCADDQGIAFYLHQF